MLALVRLVVIALVVVLGTASGALAMSSETALRASSNIGSICVRGSAPKRAGRVGKTCVSLRLSHRCAVISQGAQRDPSTWSEGDRQMYELAVAVNTRADEMYGEIAETWSFVNTVYAVGALGKGAWIAARAGWTAVAGMLSRSASAIVEGQAGRSVGAAAAEGFQSFGAFKRAMGSAGAGREWHHIVEQTAGNVAQFGPQSIHVGSNMARIPTAAHRQISAFYSSIQPQVTGSTSLTVRQWLGTQSFSQQYEFGAQVVRQFGGPWPGM